MGIGSCKYGSRKRSYLLDKKDDLANGDIRLFQSFSAFLKQALLLAQFHTAVCLRDSTSCIDPATDPIHNAKILDQKAAIDEVAANLANKEACFTLEFRENINADFLIQGVPENGNCLSDSASSDEGKNGCMAAATRDALLGRYPDWHFTVVVFNVADTALRDSIARGERLDLVTRWAPKSNNDTGAIAIDSVPGLGDRFFHVMYRKINFAPLKSWTLPFGTEFNVLKWVLTRNDNNPTVFNECGGISDDCACANVERFFWGTNTQETCSHCASFVPALNDPAATDQGFIRFQTATAGGGLPRACSTSDSDRFDFFWNGQYSGGSFPGQFTDPIDIVPGCDRKVDFVA